uniref:Aldehyde oxidase 5 n=1 Tax=Astyanax mexicanus TaxID=7994 RepID=A0A3B1JUT9_ASTMX
WKSALNPQHVICCKTHCSMDYTENVLMDISIHMYILIVHLSHCAVTACLQPICSLYGAAVVTVEGIGSTRTKLHPVQERIAMAHGSQCGFCTPGMVMSMYTLLRNKPKPSMEDIREALAGNLCRCTGYRPIIDGFKTFCNVSRNTYKHLVTADPHLCFQSERVKWISPALLTDLIQLKAQYTDFPMLVGNATLGPKMNLNGALYPVLLYAGRIPELRTITWSSSGVRVGAGCSLSALKDALQMKMEQLNPEESRIYQALLQTLQCLAAKQIRNMAVSFDYTRTVVHSKKKYLTGVREVCLNEEFFTGFGKTALRPDEILLAIDIPHSKPWEFISAFRQAQRREFAFSIVNAGMKVVFRDESAVVESLDLYYGGVGPSLVKARNTCKELSGRLWDESLLAEGIRLLKEEISLSPAAPGGRVEYRKSLILSFFFKFYMQMLLELRQRVHVPPENLSALTQYRSELPQGHHTFQVNDQSSTDPVGRPRMHQAAFQQATGEAQYYDDIPAVKGELFLSMVTSTRGSRQNHAVDGEGRFPIVHHGGVVVRCVEVVGVLLVEVVLHCRVDVLPVDGHVTVAVTPGVLVVEAQSVVQLVLDDAVVHAAPRAEGDHLLPTCSAQ